MQKVLSGIRATGALHFGSMMGAVQNFVQFQEAEDTSCLYFIADYHTLTTLKDPEQLRSNLVEMTKDYLAAGLDPEKSVIYAQSSVPQIAELSLFLSMLQPYGDLRRIPTYKDLVRNNPDGISLGLVSYPVLMAADIIGPKSNLVPVGEDQKPNVELAREIARRFNAKYEKDVFPIPEMLDDMVRVPGLDGNKMGKSDSANAIGINMNFEEIEDRYKRRAVTDPNRVRKTDPGDPENCASVYPIHKLVSQTPDHHESIARQCRAGTIGCSDCKALLARKVYDMLEPFQERRRELDTQNDFVQDVLHEGGKKARQLIVPTVEEVADCMGIIRY